MENTFILVSGLVFAAIALPAAGKLSFIERIVRRLRRMNAAVATPPQIPNEAGWTLIHADDPESFGEWLGYDEEGLPFKPGEMPSLGSHLLVELFGCDGRMLEQESYVGSAMHEAARESKATVVAESFHEFKPYGVSGAVIIQESHYTIHTWPEHRYAAIDLFYCGGT
ncbi:MAG TPA: adenosylmethionine decarboxylase, partial [Fimbriimonas sp.]